MVEAKTLIEERIKELEAELDKHDQNDFLSREIIEADINKASHMLEVEDRLS